MRIGAIDNTKHLNLVDWGTLENEKIFTEKTPRGTRHVDIIVDDIKIFSKYFFFYYQLSVENSDEFTTFDNCADKKNNGEGDLAIMILDGFLDVKRTAKKFRNHVKPACWTPNFPVDPDLDETNIQTDTPRWVSRFFRKILIFLFQDCPGTERISPRDCPGITAH